MDHLPKDPAILVSSINMLLRDEEFDNLEQLCHFFDCEPKDIKEYLYPYGYVYSEEQKQMRPIGYNHPRPKKEIVSYIEKEIIPRYAHFDAAHQEDHVRTVIAQSINLADIINESPKYINEDGSKILVDIDMVYAIAAYHDTGLVEGRDTHHSVSARIIREDKMLLQWFSPEQIEVMADAAEDHRASSKSAPRTIYGRIVAEADRAIDPINIIRRTMQYSFSHYPTYNKEEHWQRTLEHMHEKYAEGGYLKLWIPESPNGKQLAKLREIIKDEVRLRQIFDQIWKEEDSHSNS